MRENIGLFKAKTLSTKDWVEGSLVYSPEDCYYIIEHNGEELSWEKVDRETICEYTGLKDKNGRMIFENDEIYFLDGMSTENGFDDFNNTGFVKWDEEEARFYVTDRQSVSSEDALNYCTIIGNKFEEVESEY